MAKKRSAAQSNDTRPARRSSRRVQEARQAVPEPMASLESSSKKRHVEEEDHDMESLPAKRATRRKEKAQGSKSQPVDLRLSKKDSSKRAEKSTSLVETEEDAVDRKSYSHSAQEPEADVSENDSDDMEEGEWETVDVPTGVSLDNDDPEESTVPVYDDVEVVFEAPRAVLKKSKWEMAYERNLREWMHNSHVVLLIAHFMLRNKWCANRELKALCLSAVPEHIQRQCNRKDQSDKEFDTCVKWLLAWWKDYFTVTRPGFQTRAYNEFHVLPNTTDIEALNIAMEKHGLLDTDAVADTKAFGDKLVSQAGSSDISAEIFVAILRSLGFDTRLICSLQPVPYRIPPEVRPSAAKRDMPVPAAEAMAEDTSTKKSVDFPFRSPRPILEPSTESNAPKQIKTRPPTVWAEVYDPHRDRWVCLDPIRGFHDKPRQMEPSRTDRRNVLSYVLGFEEDGDGCTDVTRRYTNHLMQALKQRERELTRREKEGGMRPWSVALLSTLRRKKRGEREEKEEQELDRMEAAEQMPSSIQAFNNHSLYALERHLKKFEVLYPDRPAVLGHIKGEKVYPRSSVKTVRTAEAWMKLGRVIKTSEQPVKRAHARAVTLEKKRMQELAKQEGEPLMVNCYGEWQTEAYQPPPVVDGRVPRNQFGKVDLFTPEMLPAGAAHLPIQGLGKLAYQLGIDYAEAVVDFEFVSMRSVPVIQGIVVPEESKQVLLEAWEEHEQIKIEKTIAKEQRENRRRQEKQQRSELIHAHIEAEYGRSSSPDDARDSGDESPSMGGGFLNPEEDHDDAA